MIYWKIFVLVGCVFAYVGRALEWHSRGKGFDPPHLHQKKSAIFMIADFFLFADLMKCLSVAQSICFYISDAHIVKSFSFFNSVNSKQRKIDILTDCKLYIVFCVFFIA